MKCNYILWFYARPPTKTKTNNYKYKFVPNYLSCYLHSHNPKSLINNNWWTNPDGLFSRLFFHIFYCSCFLGRLSSRYLIDFECLIFKDVLISIKFHVVKELDLTNCLVKVVGMLHKYVFLKHDHLDLCYLHPSPSLGLRSPLSNPSTYPWPFLKVEELGLSGL